MVYREGCGLRQAFTSSGAAAPDQWLRRHDRVGPDSENESHSQQKQDKPDHKIVPFFHDSLSKFHGSEAAALRTPSTKKQSQGGDPFALMEKTPFPRSSGNVLERANVQLPHGVARRSAGLPTAGFVSGQGGNQVP